jgi:hypothetical protein
MDKSTARADLAPAMLAVQAYGCASRRNLGPARYDFSTPFGIARITALQSEEETAG